MLETTKDQAPNTSLDLQHIVVDYLAQERAVVTWVEEELDQSYFELELEMILAAEESVAVVDFAVGLDAVAVVC